MNTVLFVCIENSFRSILSEELFNAKAPEGWHAESAGVNPGVAINPAVKDLLSEVGITLPDRVPRLVTPDMVSRASRVISFSCLDSCPIGAKGKGEDWEVPGASGKTRAQLGEIRDELSRRVDDLIRNYCSTKEMAQI